MDLPIERLFVLLMMVALAIFFLILYRKSYFAALRHSFDFNGRCSRGDFWKFMISHSLLILWAASVFWAFRYHSHLHEISIVSAVLIVIYYLLTIVPVISIEIRRYHDVGKAWYWIFVPVVNVVFFFLPSVLSDVENPNDYAKSAECLQPTRFCDKCGTPMCENTKFCTHCGNQIMNQHRIKVCPNCHAEYRNDEVFCGSCGANLDN